MQITVEGHDAPVAAAPGELLLDSLLRAGLPFPFSCQTGSCGTCKCELLSGRVSGLAHSASALRDDERERGLILACRTQVWGDTKIRRID